MHFIAMSKQGVSMSHDLSGTMLIHSDTLISIDTLMSHPTHIFQGLEFSMLFHDTMIHQ